MVKPLSTRAFLIWIAKIHRLHLVLNGPLTHRMWETCGRSLEHDSVDERNSLKNKKTKRVERDARPPGRPDYSDGATGAARGRSRLRRARTRRTAWPRRPAGGPRAGRE